MNFTLTGTLQALGPVHCLTDGCKEPWTAVDPGYSMTLMGFSYPEGHDHDDNCKTKGAVCRVGHYHVFSIIPKCPAEGCGWVGKSTCFCSTRVVDWPVVVEC